ncbi:ABC transporter permease [Streptomyces sp. SID3343]|uniref:ABC transporter permease n=1 Tax=Streptomyces sp. SID3343 TaxID=2690260 RepID=UPI00136BE623|nr:ABC transporter permease [Streptomyces sp. SID3343]MYW06615.1 ABC transporter permease subunit [Streptomyces sp. SID3343]
MTNYLMRRVLGVVVVMFAVVTGMFLLLHASPVSPVNQLAPQVAADPVARAAVEHRMGLDRPLATQYLDYVGGVVRGDFGTSLYDGSSVADQIGRALPVSLELGLLAAVFAVIPAVALGVWSVLRRGGVVDHGTRVLTVVAMSLPGYWLAVVTIVVVGDSQPDLLPGAGGFVTFGEDPATNLTVLVLPAIVLGLATFAMLTRSLRGGLADAMASDHVLFARAMGGSRLLTLRRVALRGAIVPTLTVAGVLIGGLLSGTVLVENVFQIPGIGQLMVTAFQRQDYPLALGACIATSAIFLVLNLVVDLLYPLVDPRTRAGVTRERVASAA